MIAGLKRLSSLTWQRLSAFNGPGGTNVRAGAAIGAEVRVDAGPDSLVGDGAQGTDREAFPAVGAFFGDLVSHFRNAEWGMGNTELKMSDKPQPMPIHSAFYTPRSEFKNSSTYPRRYRFFPSGRPCPWHRIRRFSDRLSLRDIRQGSRAG